MNSAPAPSALRQVISQSTIAYVDADGNTVILFDKATGKTLYCAATS
jgi:hypothetical protein